LTKLVEEENPLSPVALPLIIIFIYPWSMSIRALEQTKPHHQKCIQQKHNNQQVSLKIKANDAHYLQTNKLHRI